MAERDLASVLSGAREREPTALADLCERVYPRVLKYMHYRVGAAEADDLTGEVFLRVVRSIERQSGSFDAWLFRIAGNVVIDWLRRRKTRERVHIDQDTVERHAGGTDPSEVAARSIDLSDAVRQLSADQQELVTLKFIQGLSNAEIARATGRSPEAVRALQFRALSNLRRILGRGGNHDDERS